ncbi:MAG: hypothetical protein K2H11_00775, partial [Malacoplasma sp.]|nr:hypothetical protein [Malacoplasma sp.]
VHTPIDVVDKQVHKNTFFHFFFIPNSIKNYFYTFILLKLKNLKNPFLKILEIKNPINKKSKKQIISYF